MQNFSESGRNSVKNNVDYSLYLCTDRRLMTTDTVERSVELAVQGGCTVVQLREKDCSGLEFYQTACAVKQVTDAYGVPLIINDRVDIALAVDAAGVHIGQGDLPAKAVRRIIGPDKLLGVSASNLEEAVRAVQDGADYLGVGAMFATGTKTDANLTSMEELHRIRQTVQVPIVVIGGVNRATIPLFAGSGIDGVAVVSAIVASSDIPAAAKELKELFLQGKHIS
jgi:thiamine-phosphate pyrophosphorylase